jgi:hypothetical protein
MSPETSRPTVEDVFDEPITWRPSRPTMVNVWGLLYVIPDSMPPTGEESEEQTRAYRKKDERRGSGSGPWSAGRARRDGGASANFRVRVGGGNFCFESGGYDYRGGRDMAVAPAVDGHAA